MYSAVSSSMEIIDQPVYQDIEDSLTSSFQEIMVQPRKPSLRSPLPTTRLKQSFSHDDLHSMLYEEPVCDFDPNDNYHVLKDTGSANSTMERSRSLTEQEWYDDVGINDAVVYTMNKYPPPVWKPEQGTLERPPPLPPNRRVLSSEPEVIGRIVSEPVIASHRKGALPLPPFVLQVSPAHSKPLPPPKSTGNMPSSGSGKSPVRNDMFGIRDNPVFKRKLQEKRQEIYGPASPSHVRSLSEGEELAQESYESVLFTVGDNLDMPTLPPKTASLLRDMQFGSSLRSSFSPPPPPLPSREMVRPQATLHSDQGSPLHRSLFMPPDQVSPSRQHHSGSSTPKSPPPLPSRELLDPTRPAFDVCLLSKCNQDQEDEPPPPVPLRHSSNRQGNVPSLPAERPPIQLPPKAEEQVKRRRRNSLPSPQPSPRSRSTDVSDLDRTRPTPLPCAVQRSRLAPPQALAHCLSAPNSRRSSPQLKPKPFKTPPPLTRQEDVGQEEFYDDTFPVRSEFEESYDDNIIRQPSPTHHRYHVDAESNEVTPRTTTRPSPLKSQERTTPPQNHVVLPPRAAPRATPRNLSRDKSPKQSPPVPLSKLAALRKPHPLPGPATAQGAGKSKPPVKPSVAKKPALTEKPTLAKKPALAEKPSVAKKPPVVTARKPAVVPTSVTLHPTAATRKPPGPPTPPKHYRATGDNGPSPQSSSPHLLNKHRTKPMIPKKPVPSLCS